MQPFHYMKENIERRITLQDILNYVGYSSTRFSTLFKKQMGCSPLVSASSNVLTDCHLLSRARCLSLTISAVFMVLTYLYIVCKLPMVLCRQIE